MHPARSVALLDVAANIRSECVVYVSCHSGRLARDEGRLVGDFGFRQLAVGVVAIFPHTAYVEAVAFFETS